MTVAEMITKIDRFIENSFTDADKMGWFSNIDSKIAETDESFGAYATKRVKDQSEYSLPDGVTFDKISKVVIKLGTAYTHTLNKISLFNPETEGFWYENDKINIFPTPTADDTENNLIIVYKIYPSAYSATSQNLNISGAYEDLYLHYGMAQIAYFQKAYEDYNNYINRYNSLLADYITYLKDARPTKLYKSKVGW